MDSNQERYFYLSGVISVGMFLFLLFLIGFTILKNVKIQQFAMVQSEQVSIAVNISDMKVQPRNEPEPEPQKSEPEPVPEEPQKVEEPPKPEAVADISDLFSQLKTEVAPKKKVEDKKQTEALNALEKELLNPSDTAKISEKVKNIEMVKPAIQMSVEGGSTGPVVNEYHAKIQGIVHSNFHPPQGTQGQVSKVQVKISADGKLIWFKVKRRSGNQPYDNEVQWLKERLEKVTFPRHPEQRDTILEFILRAKE